MPRTFMQSPRNWLQIGLVAAVGFVFFSIGLIVLALVTSQPPDYSPSTLGTRLVVSIVVAATMTIVERRRHTPSVDAAIVDGLQVAAVVIVAGNLTGTTDFGLTLAMRSAMLLTGLPLLEVLTHVLVRDSTAARPERGSLS